MLEFEAGWIPAGRRAAGFCGATRVEERSGPQPTRMELLLVTSDVSATTPLELGL